MIKENTVPIDRWTLKTANAVFAGKNGRLVSRYAIEEMKKICRENDAQILIIDPFCECYGINRELEGTVVQILPGGSFYDPMEIDTEAYLESIEEKCDFFASLYQLITAQSFQSSDCEYAKSFLDRCLNKTYEPYKASGFDPMYRPTFHDLLSSMKELRSDCVENGVFSVLDFSARLFSEKSSTMPDSQVILYNFGAIGQGTERHQELLIALYSAYQKVRSNAKKNIRTMIYLWDTVLFLQNDVLKHSLEGLHRRVRRLWGGITFLIDDISVLLQSNNTIACNCSLFCLASQAHPYYVDLDIKKYLELDDRQYSWICEGEQADHGLLSIDGEKLHLSIRPNAGFLLDDGLPAEEKVDEEPSVATNLPADKQRWNFGSFEALSTNGGWSFYPFTRDGEQYVVDIKPENGKKNTGEKKCLYYIYEFIPHGRIFRGHKGKCLSKGDISLLSLVDDTVLDMTQISAEEMKRYLPQVIATVFSKYETERKESTKMIG